MIQAGRSGAARAARSGASRLKVVFVAPRPFSLTYGGQEIQLVETARALRELGVEIELSAPFDREQLARADLVHFFGCDHVHLQASKLLAARGTPQVVSPVFYKRGRELLAWTALARLPYSQPDLSRRVLANASAVLPNTRAEAMQLARVFGVPHERFHVVPNAVDPSRASEDGGAFRAKRLADFGADRFVLSAGRIETRKQSLTLLRAAKRADVPIAFLGGAVPAERDYERAFRAELERAPRARLLAPLEPGSPELASAFAACHVHALASRVETPGLANLEAALAGANLVLGDSPPVREVFEGHAELVPFRESAIADALRRALEAPRDALGARELVTSRFTWEHAARATLAAYERALGAPR